MLAGKLFKCLKQIESGRQEINQNTGEEQKGDLAADSGFIRACAGGYLELLHGSSCPV
jgi:hypothetical protein